MEVESVKTKKKKDPPKENSKTRCFPAKFDQTFKEKMIPILLKLFKITKSRGSIPLISKPGKYTGKITTGQYLW